MRLVKVGVGSVSTTVGAVRSNRRRLVALAHEMAADGITVASFPEQALGGYPPEDLVQWRAFVESQRRELESFAAETADLGTVFVLGTTASVGSQLFNCAAAVHRGAILGLVPKEKLPTYDIFYEGRTFSRGSPGLHLDWEGVPLGDLVFRFDFGTLAVEVCEDVWSPDGPMRRRCHSGAEIVVNVSSSPYRIGVHDMRKEILATRSGDNEATLVYANLVGGQDALVFDGGGFVFQNGRLLLDAPRFREGFASSVLDLDRTRRLRIENTTWRSDCEAFRGLGSPVHEVSVRAETADRSSLRYPAPVGGSFFLPQDGPPARSPRDLTLDELFEVLALGVRDYYRKTGVFRHFGVGLSGGRDSLLTLLVAWHAARGLGGGGEGVGEAEALANGGEALLRVFYMPSRFSTGLTRTAAETICRELGVGLTVDPIDEAFEREATAARKMLHDGEELNAVTLENIQARIRGARMWNWANATGGLFLQTSDMIEKAVGYTTVGGDLEGALSVIANVPKTVVIALLERLHARFGFEGIRLTLETSPGPELSEEQEAEDELMPFDVLDACLHLYAGEKLSPDEVAEALPSIFPEREREELVKQAHRFARLFSASIFKWVQAPLALHVGPLDLDRERALQLPVVQNNEWGNSGGGAEEG